MDHLFALLPGQPCMFHHPRIDRSVYAVINTIFPEQMVQTGQITGFDIIVE